MPRPRSYVLRDVVVSAKEAFWVRGYEATSMTDLEAATGLSRSSIYLAFGTKRDLFAAASAEYRSTFIDSILGPVETPGAGLAEAAGFFTILVSLFRDPSWQRGCLMVNTIAELGGHDVAATREGAEFADRYRAAFSNALRPAVPGSMTRRQAAQRAELLCASAMGAWVAVRADPPAAAATCSAVAAEIISWGAGPVPAVTNRANFTRGGRGRAERP